jgi:hypothetical protein
MKLDVLEEKLAAALDRRASSGKNRLGMLNGGVQTIELSSHGIRHELRDLSGI